MKYFKKQEIETLLNTVESFSNISGRWATPDAMTGAQKRLMLLVAFWHGLRVSEVINLKARNVRDGYLIVQRLKGSKKTVQPLVKHIDSGLSEYEPLMELAASKGYNDRLFPMTRDGVLKMMKRAGEASGVPIHKCHPHALKHSIAMTMKNGGKGIKEVQVYLGHVEGKNTLRYWEATEEEAAAGVGSLL